MSQLISRCKPAGAAALLLLLASLALAACGGSSGSTSSSTASASAAATTPTGTPGTGAGLSRFKALRECMQRNGVTLPKRSPGQPRGAGGFLGGRQLPNGVTRSQYEAAFKKCGGSALAGRGGGAAARLKSPAFKQAVAKFASCMRENGVNVPAPNTSGSGPIFNTQGLNTSSAQFRAADAKCSGDLRAAFSTQGAGGPGGPSPNPGPNG